MPSGHLQSPPHEPVPSAFSSTTLAGPKCPTKVGKMSACVHGSRHSSFRGLDLITIARLWTQSRYSRQIRFSTSSSVNPEEFVGKCSYR